MAARLFFSDHYFLWLAHSILGAAFYAKGTSTCNLEGVWLNPENGISVNVTATSSPTNGSTVYTAACIGSVGWKHAVITVGQPNTKYPQGTVDMDVYVTYIHFHFVSTLESNTAVIIINALVSVLTTPQQHPLGDAVCWHTSTFS